MQNRAASILIMCVACAVPLAHAAEDQVLSTELSIPCSDLGAQAETLTSDDVALIFDMALASIGCAVPVDLVSVFDIYLVDRVMLHLGAPVGPEIAQQGFFALRLGNDTISHPEARAVLAAARAMDGYLARRMRFGGMPLSQGLFRVEACEPTGTVFELAPYAAQ